MIRQLFIDRYNKIASSFKPDLFSSLTIRKSKPYNKDVELYEVINEDRYIYNLYISDKKLEPILEELPFIEECPKILLFTNDRDHIILEQKTQESLYEYLSNSEQCYSSYGNQGEKKQNLAKTILRDIKRCLNNYKEHHISYNAISPQNIVNKNGRWELSLASLLLKNDKQNDDYYKKDKIQAEAREAYALGTLLFKMLFGFVPFQRKQQFRKFSFKDYPYYLDREDNKKFLKVYLYADGLLDASPQAKELIEEALTGKMSLQSFFNHQFFAEGNRSALKRQVNPSTREIKMLSLFQQAHQSLILAAIEHRRKHPQEKINSKLIYAHSFTSEETIQHLKKHEILYEIRFDPNFQSEKDRGQIREEQERIPRLNITYFYRQDDDFDPELDLPCRDLMKLIENEIDRKQLRDEKEQQFQERVKLYAYPYTVAFQLAKYSQLQPLDIQIKIRRLTEDLLQVSQLYHYSHIDPLHQTQLIIKQFDDIKVRFRQHLNDLYKHFLNEAIRKYNVKKELVSSNQRILSKSQGLQYYKLCLKLMECSVLNRKRGRNLDLQRIETSTRKEVESDLNQLLSQYFPTKI